MEEKTNTQKKNYERLLLAIAVLFANDLGLDVTKQDSYDKLTPAQKIFAQKKYEENPLLADQVNKDTRMSEETIVKDIAKIEQQQASSSGVLKIITVGDGNVCPKCAKWQGKIVSLSGKNNSFPSIDTAIEDGFLHYGCRCSLQELDTDEIPLKNPNPRRPERSAARPDLYMNCCHHKSKIVFT